MELSGLRDDRVERRTAGKGTQKVRDSRIICDHLGFLEQVRVFGYVGKEIRVRVDGVVGF